MEQGAHNGSVRGSKTQGLGEPRGQVSMLQTAPLRPKAYFKMPEDVLDTRPADDGFQFGAAVKLSHGRFGTKSKVRPSVIQLAENDPEPPAIHPVAPVAAGVLPGRDTEHGAPTSIPRIGRPSDPVGPGSSPTPKRITKPQLSQSLGISSTARQGSREGVTGLPHVQESSQAAQTHHKIPKSRPVTPVGDLTFPTNEVTMSTARKREPLQQPRPTQRPIHSRALARESTPQRRSGSRSSNISKRRSPKLRAVAGSSKTEPWAPSSAVRTQHPVARLEGSPGRVEPRVLAEDLVEVLNYHVNQHQRERDECDVTIFRLERQLEARNKELAAQKAIHEDKEKELSRLGETKAELVKEIEGLKTALKDRSGRVAKLEEKANKFKQYLNSATTEQQTLFTRSRETCEDAIAKMREEYAGHGFALAAALKKSDATQADLGRRVQGVAEESRRLVVQRKCFLKSTGGILTWLK